MSIYNLEDKRDERDAKQKELDKVTSMSRNGKIAVLLGIIVALFFLLDAAGNGILCGCFGSMIFLAGGLAWGTNSGKEKKLESEIAQLNKELKVIYREIEDKK